MSPARGTITPLWVLLIILEAMELISQECEEKPTVFVNNCETEVIRFGCPQKGTVMSTQVTAKRPISHRQLRKSPTADRQGG